MKKKDCVSVYNPFKTTQLTAIGEYLAEKEAEGLKLSSYTKEKFTFQKSTPQSVRYCAVIYRSVKKDELLTSAGLKGWEFVSSYRDVYIFRNESPYAKPLMTDNKVALKATIGSLSGVALFSVWLLFSFFRLFPFRTGYDAPVEVEGVILAIAAACLGFALLSLIKFLHYIFWRIKAGRYIKDDREIPFYNLKQTKRLNLLNNLSAALCLILWFALLCVFTFGYSSEVWHFWLVGGVASLLIVDGTLAGKIFFERKHIAAKVVGACVLAAIMVAGIFITTQLSLQKYESNSKNFLSFGGNPVSVTEFGITEKNANEEEPIEKITPFAEYYIFRSRTHEETADGRKPFIYYYVLRSENEKIRVKYESGLKELSEKYGSTLRELQSDKWDYICREVRDGEETDCGYAVKGNTIVYLNIIEDITFEEFFEKAYENIIKDKSTAQ